MSATRLNCNKDESLPGGIVSKLGLCRGLIRVQAK